MFKLNLGDESAQKLLAAVCEKCPDAEYAALRALTVLLAYGELPEEDICARLSMKPREITAALDCFVDAEILGRRGKTYHVTPHHQRIAVNESKPQPTARANPAMEIIPVLSASETAQRLAQTPELQFLAESLQESFGRLVTQNEISHLISICDYTGLPPDVMLMIIEYAAVSGKNTLNYIKKVALDWTQREINTHAAADEQIKLLQARNEAASVVRRAFGIGDRKLVQKEKDYAAKWVHELGFGEEMLSQAYQVCIMNIGSLKFPYVDKVLTNWHSEGVSTLQDTQKRRTSAAKPSAAAAAVKPAAQPSEEFMALANRKKKL
ncbi:MAG: DnaD domain protein [Clostridia bacterium]|nr:DnaD domain protein [Clostridia bacterium]